MTDMNSNPRSYLDCIEAGCRDWQRGDDEAGRQWLQRACLLWLESLRVQEQAATDGDCMLVSPAALRTMEQILLLLQREDVTAAVDKLAYELLPELRAQQTGQHGRLRKADQYAGSGPAPCEGVDEEVKQDAGSGLAPRPDTGEKATQLRGGTPDAAEEEAR